MEGVELKQKYCRACGYDLTEVEDYECPHCSRLFDRFDASTYSTEPFELEVRAQPSHYRKQTLGLLLIFVYLIPTWLFRASGMDVPHMLSTGGLGAGIVGAVMLFIMIPWQFGMVFLALNTFWEDAFETFVGQLLLGVGWGIFLSIHLGLGAAVVGAIVGFNAGLMRYYRGL